MFQGGERENRKSGNYKISIPFRQPHILETYVVAAVKLLEEDSREK